MRRPRPGAGARDSPGPAGSRKAYSSVRVQPGGERQAVPLTRVEFEILTDRPFEAQIEIRARDSLVGPRSCC